MAFVTMLFPLGGCHSESAITESLINFCHGIPVANCTTFSPDFRLIAQALTEQLERYS